MAPVMKAKTRPVKEPAVPCPGQPAALLHLLTTCCSQQELHELCAQLGMPQEPGMVPDTARQARNLILYLQMHNRLGDLARTSSQLRPDLCWYAVPEPVSTEKKSNKVWRLLPQALPFGVLLVAVGTDDGADPRRQRWVAGSTAGGWKCEYRHSSRDCD